MEIKVSIIVPVYNVEKYLEKCVNSLSWQTYKNLEIILVNDGSNDTSGKIADALAEQDFRIRVIHKENGGAASARNLGIDEASGDYLMLVDADDWLELDAVETLVSHAKENAADVIRFNYVREFADKQLLKKNTFLPEGLLTGEEAKKVRRQILGLVGEELRHPENMNFLASSGFNMYRRNVIIESGARFVSLAETGSFNDGLFNFAVFGSVKSFEFIDKPFYHYRKTNDGAATANYRKNYIARQHVLFDKLYGEIEKCGEWEYFRDAYSSRVVLSSMEIALNAMRNRSGFADRYKEIRRMLKDETFASEYKQFSLKHFGPKWRVYYFFIKHAMTPFVYIMTKIILKLKARGVK